MKIINLALKTEFSFKQTYGYADKIADGAEIAVGIADSNSTYGHVTLEKACKKNGIKPIFGVRLMVVADATLKGRARYHGPEYIFLAKNSDGLKEIYALVELAYKQFHYWPRIDIDDISTIYLGVLYAPIHV